jgi:hypothetical protein
VLANRQRFWNDGDQRIKSAAFSGIVDVLRVSNPDVCVSIISDSCHTLSRFILQLSACSGCGYPEELKEAERGLSASAKHLTSWQMDKESCYVHPQPPLPQAVQQSIYRIPSTGPTRRIASILSTASLCIISVTSLSAAPNQFPLRVSSHLRRLDFTWWTVIRCLRSRANQSHDGSGSPGPGADRHVFPARPVALKSLRKASVYLARMRTDVTRLAATAFK